MSRASSAVSFDWALAWEPPLMPMAESVAGPAIPSTVSPFFRWNDFTAASVLPP
jgi:hypothetical protein